MSTPNGSTDSGEGRSPSGPVVVVTGASGGIGRATALAFAARGAKVALLARGEAGLAGAVRTSSGPAGERWRSRPTWPTRDQVEAAADQVEAELGPIDVWVNVAFTSVFAPFNEITADEYRRVTEVSYLGYVYGTMAALRRMQPRDRGTIVQVGSALAYRGIPLQSAYCGAKHAIQGFHESLRCELLHEGQRARDHGADAGGQHPAVRLGAVPAAQATPSRYRRSTSRRSPPRPLSTRPTTPTAGSTGSAAHCGTLAANAIAPGLLDRYLARTGFSSQQNDHPPKAPAAPTNLWAPADGDASGDRDYGAHGSFDDTIDRRSVQLWASQHHGTLIAAAASALTAAGTAVLRRR